MPDALPQPSPEDRADSELERMIGHRYLFSARPLYPVGVIAMRGGFGDWAAYAAGLPTYSEPQPEFWLRVYREGCKLSEEQARAFFPGIPEVYRP